MSGMRILRQPGVTADELFRCDLKKALEVLKSVVAGRLSEGPMV